MTTKKNIYLLSLAGWNDTTPMFWCSAKTYYEKHGRRSDDYNWVLPIAEFHHDLEDVKRCVAENPPEILGVSLYVWNYEKSLALCEWVKQNWPGCLVITGGPHQYFKHHDNWFQYHWFIDASLPGEVYGELAMTDILDNLTTDNTLDWNLVEQIAYPSADRIQVLRSPKATHKRNFDWDYSGYQSQIDHLREYTRLFHELTGRKTIMALSETTRGCPYSCTFCDWGGGVGTKVVLKDLDRVKQDLDALVELSPNAIMICDANFGIIGERDVSIVQYLADKKMQRPGQDFPILYYGGFAKTNKHFDYIKRILTIEAENDLSNFYKISQQSFSDEVLSNVKRTDLSDSESFELALYLRDTYNYDATLEIIMGLPGSTLDTWYAEFNRPYEFDILVRAYEWFLLPEAESFGQTYRTLHNIQTSKKQYSQGTFSIPSEVVVGGKTFSREDYKEFTASNSWYLVFTQGGVYRKSIKELLQKTGWKFGDFLRKFYDQCYPQLKAASPESFEHYETHLTNYVADGISTELSNLNWGGPGGPDIAHVIYFIVEFFMNYEVLGPVLEDWLVSLGADQSLVNQESQIIYSRSRMNSTHRNWLTCIKFDKYQTESEFLNVATSSQSQNYGEMLTARPSWTLHPLSLWYR
jgi:putative methyltransferase